MIFNSRRGSRRFLIALLAAALLFPVAPAAAAPIDRGDNPQPALNTSTSCTDEIRANYHAGMFKDIYNLRVYGIETRVNPPTNASFRPCSETQGIATHDGAFAWVALQPGAESTADPSSILQIGIASCREAFGTVCFYPQMNYFWAIKGCGGALGVYDLGPANDTIHTYRVQSVYINSHTYFKGYIDGAEKFTVAQSDARLSCWIGQDTAGVWSGELWDGGDSYGTGGGAQLWFQSSIYRTIGGSWVGPSWNAANACLHPADDSDNSNHVCDVTQTDTFAVYSIPN
jgi:hypothetical protein